MAADEIVEGSLVLLDQGARRRKVLVVSRGRVYSSDRGALELGQLVGKPYGSDFITSRGQLTTAYRPLLFDLVYSFFSRPAQVIYPKDAGLAMILLEASPGKRVLEIGVGSGAITAFMANLVRPQGRVYAYEIREDMARVALENLRKAGLESFVDLKVKDASEGIDETGLDAAFVDIGDPWRVIEPVHRALRPSAPLMFFIPTFNQVVRLYQELEGHGGWGDLRCFELLERRLDLKPGAIRPSTRMIGHTGYLFFARRRLKAPQEE